MEQKPFHQKEKIGISFPFLARDSKMPTFEFPLHWHERIEILYILTGKLVVSIKGKIHKAQQGDIIIVDTGLIHGYFDSESGTSTRLFQFGLEIFDETAVEIREREFKQSIFSRKVLISADKDGETHTRLENLLMEMYAEYQQKNVGYRLSIKSKLYELATLLLREVPADWSYYMGVQKWKSSNNNLCLEHILSFIFDNFDDSELTLEKAADAIGLSKFHLTRFLKEHTGQGFHEYLCRMRVRSAEKYLAESDVPVTDIAYQCGFSSLSTFNRLFKSYTSLSPSTYRIGKA